MRTTKLPCVLAAAFVLALPVVAWPQAIKREPARPIDSVQGVDVYNAYCAVCHGKDGKGNGPAAPALKMPVPDLTMLAKKSGGFSSADVEAAILGTAKMTPAHGSPEMPIWGPVFRALNPDEGMRKLRLVNLIKYLESIQAK
jgi:mono/diheme cytochrome c family protein